MVETEPGGAASTISPVYLQEYDIDDLTLAAWNQRDKNPEWAEAQFLKVLEEQPNNADALRFYGVFLSQKTRHAEAIPLLKRCLAYEPTNAVAWCDLGAAYSKLGNYTASIDACNRALTIAPNMPSARFNRATPLLVMGDWANGWKDYEYGKICGVRVCRFLQPDWNGWSSLEGKTVYLWAEQGYGDQLMTVQLIPLLRERYRPAKVILEVSSELVALMQTLPFVDEIVASPPDMHEPLPFDEHISLMSLPAALNLTQADLPGATSYLTAEPVESEAKVGLCLRGSKDHHDDKNRSILDDFTLPVPFVELGGTKQAGMDWLQTARIVAGLDLVITVDTGVAHLAGAMGKPVWILLPFYCDYRWGMEGERTPWYRGAFLFRQLVQGDWEELLRRVSISLIGESHA